MPAIKHFDELQIISLYYHHNYTIKQIKYYLKHVFTLKQVNRVIANSDMQIERYIIIPSSLNYK
jgi:hypothetical protein